MATKILKTWINNIYNSINAKITAISNGVATMTVPTDTSADAQDINTIVAKLNALQSDKFFSTAKDTLFTTYAQVSKGTKITTTTKNQLDTIVTNFQKAVCKNEFTNQHGSQCSQNNNTVTYSTQGSNTKRQKNGYNQQVGNYGETGSCSDANWITNNNGTAIDILNTRTS